MEPYFHRCEKNNKGGDLVCQALCREGIFLLAIGPMACLRVLYYRVYKENLINRFFMLPIDTIDYELGCHIQKVKNVICELSSRNTKGIILYITCADLICGTNYDKVASEMEKKLNIPIKVLRRGPLSKRKILPKERLAIIQEEIALFNSRKTCCSFKKSKDNILIKNKLPVIAADYSGAESVLFDLDVLSILYTPGGCKSNITEYDEIRKWHKKSLLFASNMDDIDAVTGSETKFINESISLVNEEKDNINAVAIIGTTITSIIGTGFKNISRKIGKSINKNVISINCDGFQSYCSGISKTLIALGKEFLSPLEKVKNSVNILGYTPLSFGKKERLDELREVLKACHVNIIYDSSNTELLRDFKNSVQAELNIIISETAIPFGIYMEKHFQVPYVVINPVGLTGMSSLLMLIEENLNIKISKEIYAEYDKNLIKEEREEGCVIISEALLGSEIEKCLKEDYGYKNVRTICYRKKESQSASSYFYEKVKEVEFIDSEKELEDILQDDKVKVIIGDPLYKNLSKGNEIFIEIPHTALSGVIFENLEYEFIGKKGAEYFEKYLV